VADHAAVEAAADAVEETFGAIDVWVNNAMATVFSFFEDIEPEEFKRATEVSYLAEPPSGRLWPPPARQPRCAAERWCPRASAPPRPRGWPRGS
jgi:NAD(P)-dependent dehydrogenase (short-subunit alcohol dehydrogenase family)